MKPAASSMIKFSYGALALNLLCALVFYLMHDIPRTVMFLCGSLLWIVVLLIWFKNEKDGT